MKRVAQICIQPTVVRPARRELGENARAEQCDGAAGHPDQHHEKPAADEPSDDRRIHEDARADDAAHDDERRVAGSEAAQQFRRRFHSCLH